MTRAFGTSRTPVMPIALVAAVSLAAGMCVAVRPSAGPLMASGAVLAMLSLNWRHGVTLLLILLPFSGVPVFMGGAAGLELRDAAIILPLYVAFALAVTRDTALTMPRLGAATPALAIFAALVLLHMPVSQPAMVSTIATKVWLAYIPMLALGYCYVRRIDDFDRVMRVTALVGLIPAAIAIGEWYLAAQHPVIVLGQWKNDFGPFRFLYGASYDEARGSSLSFPTAFHTFIIPRIPSTFTSVTQYYGFALVAFAAGLSQALRHGGRGWTLCAVALGLGTIASGARLAYVSVPLVTAAAVMLAGPSRHQVTLFALAGGTLLAVSVLFVRAPIDVLTLMPGHFMVEATTASRELRASGISHLIGRGTGWDTQSALRYGGSSEKQYIENWYAKAALELGFAGLASIVIVMASLSTRLLTSVRRMEPQVRRLAAPVAVLLLCTVATLFKGPVIDVDPLNVYFWLFAGMLLGIARLSEAAPLDSAGEARARDVRPPERVPS
jgi:hypothetical protein